MRRINFTRLAITSCVFLTLSAAASAEVINFEQFTGPTLFGAPSQILSVPTSIGAVTISGGTVLTQETNLPADQTSVYASASFGNTVSGYSNPITIKFPQAITNFFLDVYNGNTDSIEYTVSDNTGTSSTFTLPDNFSGGQSLIGFPATGNIVTIAAGPSTTDIAWDFSIDNVTFNEPLPPSITPEPASVGMFALGFIGVGLLALKKRKSDH